MRVLDARLAIPAGVAWVGALVLIGVSRDVVVPVAWSVATAAIALSLATWWSLRRTRSAVPSLLALALIAGAVGLAAPARTPPALTDALDGAPTELVVQLELTATPETTTVPARIVGVVQSEGAVARVSVPVRLLSIDVDRRTPLGTTLVGTGRLIPVGAGDGRVALVRVIGAWTPTRDPPPLLAAGDALRERFLALMEQFGGDGAVLLPGLAIGDTSEVPDDLDLAMKQSALSHLTAVSGANCAIVVGLILGLGGILRWPRWVRITIALAALGFFVVLVTPEPSVIRAAIMATAVLLATQVGRPVHGLPVLALAVIGIIVLDPWIARQYGFVLSVLATAALLVLAGPIADRLSAIMPPAMALWVAVPLAAQLACQPVLILLQPEVPVWGVVANILAAPAAPVATVVGMIACVLAPGIPWVATVVAAIAWVPSAWIAGVARVSAGMPGALVPWPEGALGATLLAVLTGLVLIAWRVPVALGSQRFRRRLVAAGLVAAVITLGVTAGRDALTRIAVPTDWVIAQCDVGQGDAVLVRDGPLTVLIDTGPTAEALGECLDVLRVDQVDVFLISHFDLDHVGGVEAILGRVAAVWTGPVGRDADQAVLDALIASGAEVHDVRQGDVLQPADARWEVLWPPDHRGVAPGNDASVVVDVRFGAGCPQCPSLLALGDLGESVQRTMMATADVRPVDVVKVSHHGSPDQFDEVYARAGAAVGLIGVGADNSYGHPAASVIDAVVNAGGTVSRSDLHGLVLVGADEDGLWVWHERPGGVAADQ
ncbi:competence protein ComEC [Microcella alkaliphila]|uniref:Competence protein ComEC n=1 Tax=Microcella alkaliphila TaxID=279828 RepID=A0A4Q7TUG8_9MICO|nr:ComEC/Rec2 family competence protein [Microcella alkaliphila]RZT63940.1 competence protein ComEC [Microcella alkaliphila]